MKQYDCVQGSQEWLRIRAGIPTSSEFEKIITPSGRRSGQWEKYMYTLLAERLLGRPTVGHVSWWMERGSEMEERAVSYYEFQRDVETTPVGFVTTDDGRFGASPDRFVGSEGSLEIKCPSEPVHMMFLLRSGGAYTEYKVQVQGQLLVCKRQWTDVLSWHPDLPPAIVRIELDTDFTEKMVPLLTGFCEELEGLTLDLNEIRMPSSTSYHERKLTDALKESLIQLKPEASIPLPPPETVGPK
jgi:hypothetical protein